MDENAVSELTGMRVWMAMMPYAVVVIVFGIANLVPSVMAWLKDTTLPVTMPLLKERLVTAAGDPVKSDYAFPWLNNPGTFLLISGIIVAVLYSIFNEKDHYALSLGDVTKEIGATAYRMRFSALTIIMVLALAYVMNYSGQTVAMGTFVAGLGGVYAFLAPTLGWIGTAVTGSDTSANALFSKLQLCLIHT